MSPVLSSKQKKVAEKTAPAKSEAKLKTPGTTPAAKP